MADAVSLTRRELDVMSVLWRRGRATVAEVRDDLADDLAYPTVQTMLRVLEGKGYVGHTVAGRASADQEAAAEAARRGVAVMLAWMAYAMLAAAGLGVTAWLIDFAVAGRFGRRRVLWAVVFLASAVGPIALSATRGIRTAVVAEKDGAALAASGP